MNLPTQKENESFDKYILRVKLKWLLAYPKADIENKINELNNQNYGKK